MKENVAPDGVTGRITRARTAALRVSSNRNAREKENNGGSYRSNSKRVVVDENKGVGCKKRAVLQNVTNIYCDNSLKRRVSAAQVKHSKNISKGNIHKVPSVSVENFREGNKNVHETVELDSKSAVTSSFTSQSIPCTKENDAESSIQSIPCVLSGSLKPEKRLKSSKSCIPNDPKVDDIDQDTNDPHLCSLYAYDIYKNLHTCELARKLYPNFMETIQKDITQTMRGILVDWLVEVTEEYKLVSDTLYLTVFLIDWYLSKNYIERQKLQLLGITCMLIACKYEELCAPRVEEFCFITDNTYTRDEVLDMETQVLKYLGFRVFAPTAKTFLRRFLRAARASFKGSEYVLEQLADYLAELTLVDYRFLMFLPSMIAASAVFLSKWTLDQTVHPWDATLEFYTSYKASDLKDAVVALRELQLNANDSSLNAIRTKYKQQKFNAVANLSSPQLKETLFEAFLS